MKIGSCHFHRTIVTLTSLIYLLGLVAKINLMVNTEPLSEGGSMVLSDFKWMHFVPILSCGTFDSMGLL